MIRHDDREYGTAAEIAQRLGTEPRGMETSVTTPANQPDPREGLTSGEVLAGADQMAEALRAAGWRVEPPNASTIIRTGYGMTEPYRKRLCQWARDNGLNPGDIPADARIEVDEDTITTEVTVRGEDGKPDVDSGTVLRERITVPLSTPWAPA